MPRPLTNFSWLLRLGNVYFLQMNKFTTNIPALTNLCDRLNAANVKGAKPILTTLGNYPSVQTWEAYTLIGACQG